MSISAVSGVSPATPQAIAPAAIAPVTAATPFSQQLDAQNAQDAAAHGHHHHHGGASQSLTASAATAASAAGVTAPSTLASSLIHLLS